MSSVSQQGQSSSSQLSLSQLFSRYVLYNLIIFFVFCLAYNTSDHSGKMCNATAKVTNESEEKPCVFDLALLGDCNPKKNPKLGLDEGKPCIFIRVNKVRILSS